MTIWWVRGRLPGMIPNDIHIVGTTGILAGYNRQLDAVGKRDKLANSCYSLQFTWLSPWAFAGVAAYVQLADEEIAIINRGYAVIWRELVSDDIFRFIPHLRSSGSPYKIAIREVILQPDSVR